MSRWWRVCVAVALVLALGACGGDDGQAAFAGHWTSPKWGDHYIVVQGDTMKVIYTHDNGRAYGTIDGTTFVGWWTETPSRRPTADAGTVEFRLEVDGESRTIDGIWRYGSEGREREDWDLAWADSTIPPDIAAQFSDDALFVRAP